jgi:hypothetical protein
MLDVPPALAAASPRREPPRIKMSLTQPKEKQIPIGRMRFRERVLLSGSLSRCRLCSASYLRPTIGFGSSSRSASFMLNFISIELLLRETPQNVKVSRIPQQNSLFTF